jgi:signal transduction histidine kinase
MEVLTSSAIEAARGGSSGEELREIDLRSLVESACDDWADTATAVRCERIEDASVLGRPTEIRRALLNLVDNAVKFGSAAEIRLARDGPQAVLTVEDDGPGMPEEMLERAFEPFIRGDESRSNEGFGLGLSIARSIIERHGGSIALRNRSSGGLHAEVRLPLSSPAR